MNSFSFAAINEKAYGESPYIFGIHDPGGEFLFEQEGKTGWIVFTESLGSDAKDLTTKDYSSWAMKGHGIIVRLNYSYSPNGTLPCSAKYSDFVTRVESFVKFSKGSHIWIIGNEINLPDEWPQCEDGKKEAITPQKYAQLFKKIRERIHKLDGQ